MSDDILSRLRIDRHSQIPVYRQLHAQLERFIVNGAWRPHDPLPSENALAAALGISVMTVRQGMGLLVAAGLVYREKGRGTFVIPRPLDHHLQRLEGFSEDMGARGLTPSSQVLAFESVPAPDAVQDRFGLEPGIPVLHIKRLRLVDNRPVAVHDAYINHLNITRGELEAAGSLYDVLERQGVQLMEADETLEAIAADKETAALLQIEHGAPLLKASRLTWDHAHNPVELVFAVYRGDFYRYAVRLRR